MARQPGKNLRLQLSSSTPRHGRPRVAREACALRSSSQRAFHARHAFVVAAGEPELGEEAGLIFSRDFLEGPQASTLARVAPVVADGRARGASARRAAAAVTLGSTGAGAGSAAAGGRAGAGHVGVGGKSSLTAEDAHGEVPACSWRRSGRAKMKIMTV